MTFLLAGSSFAKEPVGDWQTVQNDIPRGWQITVVTAFAFPCIFEQANDKELVQINHIATSDGARTSLLLASDKKFLLAVPERGGSPAALWVYNLQ